jgi:hypothetical protein
MKSCRVTVFDMEGVAHTVEVTAGMLYEAVAMGLKQIRGNDWVEGLAGVLNTVTVCVKNVQVEHAVRVGEFTKWLERKGGSPGRSPGEKRSRKFWECREPTMVSECCFSRFCEANNRKNRKPGLEKSGFISIRADSTR